ncbi:hypothetical protein GQ600_11077 [Phytophthora cactorum]|nr:hypothetical protein GQ600_11077 [Phytophthora cactorum]
MDEDASTLNAKQRRKLLREQQRQQEEASSTKEDVPIKQEQNQVEAAQNTEVVTGGDEPEARVATPESTKVATPTDDDQKLNAQQRRLLKRQAKRKTDAQQRAGGEDQGADPETIDGREYKLKQEDVDDRMIDFLSWFDYETAKKALDEYNRCVSDKVNNRKAFFMGILKRFRQTDGVE